MRRARVAVGLALAAALLGAAAPAASRSLEAIRQRGTLALCAHPNALPFASKRAEPPGFQIELGRALAGALGVELAPQWITTGIEFRRVDCDIVLDTIVEKETLEDRHLSASKPYYRSGVALALPATAKGPASFRDLDGGTRVGVQVGSLAGMILGQRGLRTVPFSREEDLVAALAAGEVDAAAVSPAAVGYFNLTHPGAAVRLVHAYDTEPELSWNVAVGLRRADPELRRSIDAALDRLLADGTVARIYAAYGIELRAPK